MQKMIKVEQEIPAGMYCTGEKDCHYLDKYIFMCLCKRHGESFHFVRSGYNVVKKCKPCLEECKRLEASQ